MKLLLPLLLVPSLLQSTPSSGGELFDSVASVIGERFYSEEARTDLIPSLTRALAPLAREARNLDEERAVIDAFLGALDVSHCALYSKKSHEIMKAELMNFEYPNLGCQLRVDEGEYCIDWVYEGGVADRAGLVRGQAVRSIDGQWPGASPLLDWTTDDAALPDPPLHALLVKDGQVVTFEMADGRVVELVAEKDNAWNATKRSVRVLERGDLRIGYVHYWFIQVSGPGALLRELQKGEFADCEVILLDLRGRGGSAGEVEKVLKAADPGTPDGRRVVALTDRGTRSAKEVIAHEVRRRDLGLLVGEPTAGAVIPATFQSVSDDAVLMFPSFTLGRYTEELEGKPVQPDIAVEDDFRSAPDEILDAAIEIAVGWLRSSR